MLERNANQIGYACERLQLVLDQLDELFVGTLDSFSQTLLREFAFESGKYYVLGANGKIESERALTAAERLVVRPAVTRERQVVHRSLPLGSHGRDRRNRTFRSAERS